MKKPQQRPREGGSFVVQSSGKLKKVEGTLQPHDREHSSNKLKGGAITGLVVGGTTKSDDDDRARKMAVGDDKPRKMAV